MYAPKDGPSALNENQLKVKPHQIGTKGSQPVMECETKGGLHLVMAVKKNGDIQTVGVGPHKAIARFMATKDHPDIKITSLEKSESLSKTEIVGALPNCYKILKLFRDAE
jgi:hypothetical protein